MASSPRPRFVSPIGRNGRRETADRAKCSSCSPSHPAPANKKFPAASAALIDLLPRFKRVIKSSRSRPRKRSSRTPACRACARKTIGRTPDDFEQYKDACTKTARRDQKTARCPGMTEAAHSAAAPRPEALAPHRRRRRSLHPAKAQAANSISTTSSPSPIAYSPIPATPFAKHSPTICGCSWSTNFRTPIHSRSTSSR